MFHFAKKDFYDTINYSTAKFRYLCQYLVTCTVDSIPTIKHEQREKVREAGSSGVQKESMTYSRFKC